MDCKNSLPKFYDMQKFVHRSYLLHFNLFCLQDFLNFPIWYPSWSTCEQPAWTIEVLLSSHLNAVVFWNRKLRLAFLGTCQWRQSRILKSGIAHQKQLAGVESNFSEGELWFSRKLWEPVLAFPPWLGPGVTCYLGDRPCHCHCHLLPPTGIRASERRGYTDCHT